MNPTVPQRMWSLANMIVAFAAAQTMAFLFAAGNKDFGAAISQGHVPTLIAVLSAGSTSVYVWAVLRCHRTEMNWYAKYESDESLRSDYRAVSRGIVKGRIAALLVCWLLSSTLAIVVDGKHG